MEQRKHKRYHAKKGAFAAVRPLYVKIGRITDISQGGLAFRYMVTESQEDASNELDIFLIGNAFHLDRIPLKTISDLTIAERSSPRSLAIRRCGVQFGELTQDQKLQLDLFIQHHIVGEA